MKAASKDNNNLRYLYRHNGPNQPRSWAPVYLVARSIPKSATSVIVYDPERGRYPADLNDIRRTLPKKEQRS